ncbi:MAG: 2-oxo acid dehydrogenase subunit E2 [Phycisphaerales bacterium]|jgi:pyruvate dehydrogenase E2 component (dihydrolipoamide acetyltransferase)|nr:2-oxo acid dehydrogenase subunit E2 [Phycisphaeraceae bacterium]
MGHAKSSDPNVFILPDLGEGVHEAELLKWRVSVGQTVEEHQILAEMNTDKAQVEVPSPRAGTIAILHGKEGEILHVGNPLVSYVAEGASAAAPAAAPSDTAACGTGSQIAANLPTHTAGTNGAHASGNAEKREDAGTVVGAVGGELGGISAAPGKALATPAVRRLARDLGVNIDSIGGTGLAGRVTEKDVRAAASGTSKPAASTARPAQASAPATMPAPTPSARPSTPSAAPAPKPGKIDDLAMLAAASGSRGTAPSAGDGPLPPGQDTQRIPVRGVRRTIANRLRESMNSAVHFTVMDEADVSALDNLRRKLASASGEKVSFLPFVASAVCRALSGQFAALNAHANFDSSSGEGEIVRHRAVHLGIATDTDTGLMVPVVRDADKLGVLEIGRHITHVAEAARSKSASREMLMGSTFTISNVGSHAGRFATPVINVPEVAIIAVGRARDGVVVRNGAIAVGKMLPLSLACDHRVIDGAMAALALASIIDMLQNPEQLLGPARA